MRKKFSKILAMILTLGMIASFCAVPMSVSAAPAGDDTYDTYDVVTYNDLLSGGNPLSSSRTAINGNPKFAYNRTSPSYSVIFKYRWTAGSYSEGKPYYVFYFDKWGGSAYPFALAVKSPGYSGLGEVAGANGAWHLDPSQASHIVQMSEPIVAGNDYDIEHGRLKVVSGANTGKYYVFVKVNGTLIYDYYYDGDNGNGTYGSGNQAYDPSYLRFTDGTSDNYISAIPEPDVYDDYDEVYYSNFIKDGSAVDAQYQINSKKFTYNKTSASASTVIKYRWKNANTNSSFYLAFDPVPKTSDANAPATVYAFGTMYSAPNGTDNPTGKIWLRIGNGSSQALPQALVNGNDYDIEYGRLKVVGGTNTGKYKLYINIADTEGNSVYYEEKYIDANFVDSSGNYTSNTDGAGSGVACSLSNSFNMSFWGGGGGNVITNPAYTETYEDYDEIYYSNLLYNGSPVAAERSGQGRMYTYNKTTTSGSAVLKLRWKEADAASQFQISFDRKGSENAINYMFGVQLSTPTQEFPTGYIWLRPGYGDKVALPEAVVSGNNYDIEFARLKVASGPNKNKYYLYFKWNGTLLAESYVAANVVDASGNYTSSPSSTACHISDELYITFWGGSGSTITNPAYTETYYDYDVVTYDDFRINGNPLSESGTDLGSTRTITYNVTSETYSSVIKYRWIPGTPTENKPYYVFYYDEWSGNAYPFSLAVKSPGYGDLGAAAGENGAWDIDPSNRDNIVQMSEPVVNGGNYDIEFGRLKVANGPYKDQYYVFLKVNDALIGSYYYDGVAADGSYKNGAISLTNILKFTSGNSNNRICAIPVPETYEDYDEIGYSDLMENGEPLRVGGADMSGGTTLTYNRTSETYSVILKYLWKVGSKQKFQLSFDKYGDNTMSYMFGAWLSAPGEETGFDNGRMWLKPGSGPQVNLSSALTTGSSYNVEFARLKVKTGRNTGKYYMYVKIDDTLIAETYVDASGIATDGTYTSNTDKTFTLSNEIQLNFWGSEHNAIAPYKMTFAGQEGVTVDFDDDGVLGASDLAALTQVMLGVTSLGSLPDGMADFNKDGDTNILDLIAFKKFLAPVNTYAKSGSLNLGMQEHLLESDGSFVDNTKTAAYIADATATMGANTYRLSKPIHSLFYVTSTNGVTVATENMTQFKGMVAALKAQGINNILYVTDSFMLPYGYSNPSINHNKTVPTPGTTDYEHWLTVNANAFAALATEVPEIKFFEPFNEINLTTTGLEKPGIPWDAPAATAANYKYTVAEKAGIMADLCWYVSRAVKGVDAANQVTTPSITVGTESIIENNFLSAFYNAIDSGAHPSFKAAGDKRADNYFTIVNIHAYPEYVTGSSSQDTKVNNIASMISSNIYSVMQAHNDGGSRVWLTETGVSIFGSRTESNGASLLSKFLNKINTNMTYIDTVIFYKIADASASSSITEPEKKFGLFYAGDASSNAYGAKQTAKTVYSFFHNGSTDYSALTALTNRYN